MQANFLPSSLRADVQRLGGSSLTRAHIGPKTLSRWNLDSPRQQAARCLWHPRGFEIVYRRRKNRESLLRNAVCNEVLFANSLHSGPLGFARARCACERRFEPRERGTWPPSYSLPEALECSGGQPRIDHVVLQMVQFSNVFLVLPKSFTHYWASNVVRTPET